MHPEAPTLDGPLDAGAALGRRAPLLVQERLIDLLEVDASVLYRLDSFGDLKDLAGGLVGIGVRPGRR
jgi:hypothetical protein